MCSHCKWWSSAGLLKAVCAIRFSHGSNSAVFVSSSGMFVAFIGWLSAPFSPLPPPPPLSSSFSTRSSQHINECRVTDRPRAHAIRRPLSLSYSSRWPLITFRLFGNLRPCRLQKSPQCSLLLQYRGLCYKSLVSEIPLSIGSISLFGFSEPTFLNLHLNL